jgi:membrane-bound lytic murein transglycosylase D
MHDRFGSWYLSAAGYNTGENRVGRLMKERNGTEKAENEDSYWEIWDRLPRETRDYVPLMLAMGTIAKEPAKYGFTDLKMQAPLQFEEVTVPGGTKLSEVAISAGVDAQEIEDLNPHLIRKMTPPGKDWKVRVPIGRSEKVVASLSGAHDAGSADAVAVD